MTIAKDFAAKAAVAAVAVAVALVALAPSVKAQTTDELQQMINDLLAQVSALQGQVGQGGQSVASGVCPYTWTRDLSAGSTGADVMKLQQFLNADADTRVAAEGAGSVGMETEYYGPATAAAVSKMQVKYRADILSPANLVNPTGYFGPSTRAKANAICGVAVPPPVDDADDADDATDDSDDSDVTLSGEADLEGYTADDADDDSLNEGDEDAPVAIFTATFENGDASISRLDVAFVSDADAQPWQTFDTVSLWVDGDKVAEEEAGAKSDYLGDEDLGIIRFSGLDIVAMEDEDVEVTVAVSLQNGLDAEALSANSWTVTTESMRYFDADGVASTDDTLVDDETAEFTIDEAGTNDTADIEKNTDTPDAQTLLVDDKTAKEAYDVFMFNIDVDEDSSDLEVGMAYATVTVSNPAGAGAAITAEDVISRVYLTIDDEKVDGDADAEFATAIAADAEQEVVFEFDFDGYELTAGEVHEAVVNIEFKGQNEEDNYENGVTIDVDVDGTLWDVDGPDSSDVLEGSRSAELQTLSTVVPEITDVDSSVEKNEAGDAGTISFQFTVGANDDDVVLDVDDTDAIATSTGDVVYTVSPEAGGDFTAVLSEVSGDAEYNAGTGEWTIAEGDEATFALDVTFTSTSSANTYRVTLESVGGVEVDETSTGMSLTD